MNVFLIFEQRENESNKEDIDIMNRKGSFCKGFLDGDFERKTSVTLPNNNKVITILTRTF